MHNLSLAADILAAALVVAIPLTAPFERRIYGGDPKTPLKLAAYGANIVLSWTLTAVAVWIDGWGRLSISPTAGQAWLWAPTISSVMLWVGVAAYLVLGLLPLLQSLRGLRWRRAYAAAYRRSFSSIPGMLPNTAVERLSWIPLSLTAGICEEVLFRGFLIRFLHESSFGLPVAWALVASSLLFGLGHAYQGVKGVVGSTIGGFAFGLLFLLSGSLFACVILHALVDLQVPYLLRPMPEDETVTGEAVCCASFRVSAKSPSSAAQCRSAAAAS
jgi:membrane protease YdiL (CAAX protease family)